MGRKQSAPWAGPVIIPEGFTPWQGGENPVPGKTCEVVFRHQNTLSSRPRRSSDWHWHHTNSGGDVIAYRVTS